MKTRSKGCRQMMIISRKCKKSNFEAVDRGNEPLAMGEKKFSQNLLKIIYSQF